LAEKVKAAKATLAENTKSLQTVVKMLDKLELHDIEEDDDDEDEQAEKNPEQQQQEKPANVLQVLSEEDLDRLDAGALKGQIAVLEGKRLLFVVYKVEQS
jgi:seryl-tRNA synthetase